MNTAITKLTTIKNAANEAHDACLQAGGTMLNHAIRCGGHLADAKQIVGHGEWAAWLKDNFKGSERSARRYMQIFENREQLSASKRPSVADLTMSDALEFLAKPKALPEPAKAPTSEGTITALFDEVTYITSQEDLESLAVHLIPAIQEGYVPGIGRDDIRDLWVWHSLRTPDGSVSLKPAAMQFAENVDQLPTHDLGELCQALAGVREDMGDRWPQHCEAQWGPVGWVNETIDTVNNAMADFDSEQLAMAA